MIKVIADVLVFDENFSFMAFALSEQIYRIETRSLGTAARNLKFLDGEDVDVLWSLKFSQLSQSLK